MQGRSCALLPVVRAEELFIHLQWDWLSVRSLLTMFDIYLRISDSTIAHAAT